MVKKTEKTQFDNRPDKDWNWDDFDVGSFEPSKKESKKRQAITEFGGSFISGVKSSVLNRDNLRRLIGRSLPKGYTRLWDTTTSVVDGVKEVYADSKSETQKVLEELKEPIADINRVYGKKLPPALERRLKEFGDSRSSSYTMSRGESALSDMRASLSDIFDGFGDSQNLGTLATTQAIDEGANKQVAATISSTRASLLNSRITERVASGVERLASYNDNVRIKVDRKMVELGFKQYSTTLQILDVLQQTRDMQKSANEAIVKNTGLPESLKIHNAELFGQIAKQRFMGKVTDRVQQGFGKIGQGIIQNVTTNLRDRIQNFGAIAGMSAAQLQQLAQMSELRDEMGMAGPSRASMAGTGAAMGLEALIKLRGNKYFGKALDKYQNNPTLQKYGDRIINMTDALPSWFDRTVNETSNPLIAMMSSMFGLDELTWKQNTRVRGSAVRDLERQEFWNLQDHLSLTEIIPGHLENIHQSLERLRTGKDVGRVRYDHSSATFRAEEDIQNDLSKSHITDKIVNDVNDSVTEIIKALDPDQQLGKVARNELRRYIVKRAQNGRGRLDLRNLVSAQSPITGKAGEEIAEVLGKSLGIDYLETVKNRKGEDEFYDPSNPLHFARAEYNAGETYQKTSIQTNQALERLREILPNGMQRSLDASRQGFTDLLANAGIIERDVSGDWVLNPDKEVDLLLGNTKLNQANRSSGVGNASPPTPLRFPKQFSYVHPTALGLPPSHAQVNPVEPVEPVAKPVVDDETGLTYFQREVLTAIERNSAKTSVDIGNQLLEAIRERIDLGVPTASSDTEGNSQDSRKRSSWYKRLISTPLLATGRKVKDYFKWSYGTAIPEVFKTLITRPFRFATGALDMVRNSVSGGRKIMSITASSVKSKLMDVYVQGREKAVLLKRDLEEGKYIDSATKKVINKLSDITGEVRDLAGNVVITQEDFESGLQTIQNGKIVKLAGRALGGTLGLAKSVAEVMFQPYKLMGRLARDGVSKLFNGSKKNQPEDVYVKGETSPRLLGWLMAAGNYFNKDGKVIRSSDDIDGEVRDKDGNVLISLQEVQQGLTNKWGKRLRSAGGILGTLLGGAVNLAGMYVRGVGRFYRGVGKQVMHLTSKLFNRSGKVRTRGQLDIDGLPAEIMAHQADTLDNIYQLLDERLDKPKRVFGDTDGDGIREGSRESWLKRLASERDKDKSETPEKKEKPKSLYGLISTIVAGVGSMIGTFKGFGLKIWGMMKTMRELQLAASMTGALGSILGGAGGKGKAGLLRRGFSFLKGSRVAQMALVAGTAFLGAKAYAGMTGDAASSGMMGREEKRTFDEIMKLDDGSSSSSGSSSVDRSNAMGEPHAGDKSHEGGYWSNLMKSVGGSVIGEAGAMATTGALAALYGAHQRKRGKDIARTPKAPPKSAMGRLWHLASENKYGRIATAAITGGLGYVGLSALQNKESDVDLENAALMSYGSTLGLGALGLGAGYLTPKLLDKYRAMKAAKAATGARSAAMLAGAHPTYRPVTGSVPTPMLRTTAPTMPKAMVAAAPRALPEAATAVAARTPSLAARGGSLLGRVGRSVGRNVGLIGAGLAAYDAATTEGSAWDKTKAFGTSLATTYAMGKGFQLATSSVARQAAWAGLRMAGSAALPLLTNPVTLGIAAVALTAYGGYKAYQRWFKKDKSGILRFRMAQYGLRMEDYKEKVAQILKLEDLCSKNFEITKGKYAKFKGNLDFETVANLFGISPSDATAKRNLFIWFVKRFRPIYLTHIQVLYEKSKKTDLKEVDSIIVGKEMRTAYIDAVYANGTEAKAYDVMEPPFADGKGITLNTDGVKEAYTLAKRNASHEKSSTVEMSKLAEKNKVESFRNQQRIDQEREQTKLDTIAASTGDWRDKAAASLNRFSNTIANSTVGRFVGESSLFRNTVGRMQGALTDISHMGDMSQSQKGWQMSVYKAFVSAKFSDNQARILTAEVGRENSYNPKHLFGCHVDPANGAVNVGMISWQGVRGKKLLARLSQGGVIMNGAMAKNQTALNIQAQFLKEELGSAPYNKQCAEFINNPNIDYQKGAYLIGKFFIRWRIDDPLYRPAGVKNRDYFYQMLNKQLGGAAKSTVVPDTKTPAQSNPTPVGRGVLLPGNAVTKTGVGSGGWGGNAVSTAAGGGLFKAPNVAAAKVNIAGVASGASNKAGSGVMLSSGLKAFLETLDPKQITFGAKCMIVQSGVDLKGMNQSFMAIFYAMIAEYFNRTGKKVTVTSGYRSSEKQKVLYDEWKAGKRKGPVAVPGRSRHNSGVAIDINSADANALNSMGLLTKYHFHRPVKSEAWHLENTFFSAAKETQNALNSAASSAGMSDYSADGGLGDGSTITLRKNLDPSIDSSMVIEQRADGTVIAGKNAKSVTAAATPKLTQDGTKRGTWDNPPSKDPAPTPKAVHDSETARRAIESLEGIGAGSMSLTAQKASGMNAGAEKRSDAIATKVDEQRQQQQSMHQSSVVDALNQQIGIQTEMLETLRSIERNTAKDSGAATPTPKTPTLNTLKRADKRMPVSMGVKVN